MYSIKILKQEIKLLKDRIKTLNKLGLTEDTFAYLETNDIKMLIKELESAVHTLMKSKLV